MRADAIPIQPSAARPTLCLVAGVHPKQAMIPPLFDGSGASALRVLAFALALATPAVRSAEAAGPLADTDAAAADASHPQPAFRFGRGLATPADAVARHEDGTELRRILITGVPHAEAAHGGSRRERPYARACNFTTSCR